MFHYEYYLVVFKQFIGINMQFSASTDIFITLYERTATKHTENAEVK